MPTFFDLQRPKDPILVTTLNLWTSFLVTIEALKVMCEAK